MSKQNNKSKPSHKFDIGGDFGISGTLQFANGLASNSKERKANEETYNNAIDNTRIGFNGISSLNNLDSLEDYLNSAGQLHELETSDLIGNNAHRIGKFLSTSSQAMQAGSNFGPWGALAGAIVGQIGAGISGWRNRKKAEKSLADINQKIRDTNELQTAMADNKLNNIMANQMADQQWDYIAALGGNLHSNSTTWSNGLNYIGSGGSHESNPNDGVAISTAPDGLQNKVEEGEVVWNDDYVFSKRLKVPKKDLEKNKWKGETYADIAKKLMDESAERPNDPITLRGLDDSLSRLKDSQEELKAKQEGNKIKKEIASMPPELLAQMQQAQQQPTEEEIMQQQAMEQMPQEQMPMVDPSMQQPMMEQPPMYAEGGHLFFGGGNGLGVNIDYSTGHSPINTYGKQPNTWNSIYGIYGKQTFNPSETVNTDYNGKYSSVGQNIQANNNGFSNPTLQGKSKGVSNSGFNKGAMFGALARGIDMTGAVIDNVWGNSGGNLDALYKGKRDNKDLPNWLTAAWNGYTGGLYAKGGHLFGGENSFIDNGGSVKAVSGKNFLSLKPMLPLVLERVGVSRDPTADEIKAAEAAIKNNAHIINHINRQNEYVNVDDAQKYGGFYKDENGNDITDINVYLDGHTPMDVNNKAQGVGNQQSRQSGLAYLNRFPVKENYGLPKDAIILDRNNKESVDFFLKKNPNLDLNSDTIYFYSKDKNDVVDKNKSVKANKVKPEVYERNNVKNISKISGINFDRTNMKAKGGHLHAYGNSRIDFVNHLNDYSIWQDLVNEANYKTNEDILAEEDARNAAIEKAQREGELRLLSDRIARETWQNENSLAARQRQAEKEAKLTRSITPTYVYNIPRTEETEVDDDLDILNDKELLLRAKEKYYPKSLTREERKELRKSKKEAKEENTKDRNLNFDPTYMRYAPVLGSIFNVARSIASRPDYGNPERIERAAARIGTQVSPKYIGDYLRYRPLDESYYLNQLNAQQNAANNAIVGLSNGNRSMALASILANDYNYNNQRGAAYRQGLEYNEAQRQRAAEFNRGTNQFNAQQYMQAAAQNASNRAQAANLISAAAQMREGIDNAYGASQSANWTNLFNNIGNVGRDEMNRNMTKDLYDYYIGRNGVTGFKGTNAKRGGYLTIKTNNRRKE